VTHFYSARNDLIASAVLATAIPSVCPSVCPSVRRRYCLSWVVASSHAQFRHLETEHVQNVWRQFCWVWV